jgi:hypothetical protein
MKDINKILAKKHFNFFFKWWGKTIYFCRNMSLKILEVSVIVMPSLLPHVLCGRSQVSLFFANVVRICHSTPDTLSRFWEYVTPLWHIIKILWICNSTLTHYHKSENMSLHSDTLSRFWEYVTPLWHIIQNLRICHSTQTHYQDSENMSLHSRQWQHYNKKANNIHNA